MVMGFLMSQPGELATPDLVADTRFQLTRPLRAAIATVLHPVERVLLVPVTILFQDIPDSPPTSISTSSTRSARSGSSIATADPTPIKSWFGHSLNGGQP